MLGLRREIIAMTTMFAEKILNEFGVGGAVLDAAPIGNGNINETYHVILEFPNRGADSYILQRINTSVFHEPERIMENIERITAHMAKKAQSYSGLKYLHAKDGHNYVIDEENGGFWRAAPYIESCTFDMTDDLQVIRATGEAFGEFQMLLSDFDGSKLFETINGFHNTPSRITALNEAAERDTTGRLKNVESELEYINRVAETACILYGEFLCDRFPVRVTHNDTKANNVLFDRDTHRPITVIDLDTVMPGMVMYDFGDAVRFIASTAAEDEADLSKVTLDINKFKAFSEGFIGKVKNSLTCAELDGMVLGVFSITIELASRFLTDYLLGDVYFKTKYADHNLIRARCQLKLAKEIMSKYNEMNRIIDLIRERAD